MMSLEENRYRRKNMSCDSYWDRAVGRQVFSVILGRKMQTIFSLQNSQFHQDAQERWGSCLCSPWRAWWLYQRGQFRLSQGTDLQGHSVSCLMSKSSLAGDAQGSAALMASPQSIHRAGIHLHFSVLPRARWLVNIHGCLPADLFSHYRGI